MSENDRPKCGECGTELTPPNSQAWHKLCPWCLRADYDATAPAQGENAPQDVLTRWAHECFGDEQVNSPDVLGLRLAEEAIEFAQAVGVPAEKLQSLIAYVFARPAGMPFQELGGVAVTALVAASSIGARFDEALAAEQARVLAKPKEHFAKRNRVKVNAGFGASHPSENAPAEEFGETPLPASVTIQAGPVVVGKVPESRLDDENAPVNTVQGAEEWLKLPEHDIGLNHTGEGCGEAYTDTSCPRCIAVIAMTAFAHEHSTTLRAQLAQMEKIQDGAEFHELMDAIELKASEFQLAQMAEALEATLTKWVDLANSGDAGFWEPEDEEHVKNARKALAQYREGQPK